MPKGYSQAKSRITNRSSAGFRPRPKGSYLTMKNGDVVQVRFFMEHDEIEWYDFWQLPADANNRYGEKVLCVDQNEDGTPDPGYGYNLRKTMRAFAQVIWRNAPVYMTDPATGALMRDGNGNKQLTGYRDQVALWDMSASTYDSLRGVADDYGGLASRDFKVRRIGGGTDTKYQLAPAFVDAGPQPMSPEDIQLVATGKIDTTESFKIPTAEELGQYLAMKFGGGVPQTPEVAQQPMVAADQPSFTQPPPAAPAAPPVAPVAQPAPPVAAPVPVAAPPAPQMPPSDDNPFMQSSN